MLADDRGEHRLHLPGGQLRQQHLPQVRVQVQADVRGVAADGGGGPGGAGDQPVRQPVPTVTTASVPSPGRGDRRRASTAIAALRDG